MAGNQRSLHKLDSKVGACRCHKAFEPAIDRGQLAQAGGLEPGDVTTPLRLDHGAAAVATQFPHTTLRCMSAERCLDQCCAVVQFLSMQQLPAGASNPAQRIERKMLKRNETSTTPNTQHHTRALTTP